MSLIDQAYSGNYPHLRFQQVTLAERWPSRPIKMMPKPRMRRIQVRVGPGGLMRRWFWRADIPGFGGAQHRDMEAAYRMLVRKWQEAPIQEYQEGRRPPS